MVEEIKRIFKSKSGLIRVAHDVADIMMADGGAVPLIETITKSLRQVRDEAENAAKVWREHLLRTATIRYKPVWSPKRKWWPFIASAWTKILAGGTMQRLSSLSSVDELLTFLLELDCLIRVRPRPVCTSW